MGAGVLPKILHQILIGEQDSLRRNRVPWSILCDTKIKGSFWVIQSRHSRQETVGFLRAEDIFGPTTATGHLTGLG